MSVCAMCKVPVQWNSTSKAHIIHRGTPIDFNMNFMNINDIFYIKCHAPFFNDGCYGGSHDTLKVLMIVSNLSNFVSQNMIFYVLATSMSEVICVGFGIYDL